MDRVVIDTNIFVSAVMNADGAPREVLRLALSREIKPIFGNALFLEYEDVLGRETLFVRGLASRPEREALFDALLSVSDWTRIYFLWRPNLPDEGDYHVFELAVAGGASVIVTGNVRDFVRGEMAFPALKILTASAYLSWRRSR